MATATIQPNTKNIYARQAYPDSNTATPLCFQDYLNEAMRSILEFGLSGLPVGADISLAKLYIYYYYYGYVDPVGKTIWAYKLTRTDWVELEATWNSYKSGSAWTAAGGDYVTSDPSGGSANIPAGYGWIEITITDIVLDAWINGKLAELLLKFETEDLAIESRSSALCRSREYAADTSKRPKIIVTYDIFPAPTNIAATNSLSDKVTVTWTKTTGATGYRVYRDDVDVSGLLGDVDTYDDTGADPPTITPGDAVATDGKRSGYVRLTIDGFSFADGTEHTYKVKAFKAYAESDYSSEATGYRWAKGDLTYQWQRSAADSDASYSNITGGISATYNDYGAPAYPAARYFKCVISMTDAATQTTAADRGYRRRADAPANVVNIIIKNRDGDTLGHVMNLSTPGIDYRINKLPSCSFKLPSDEAVCEHLVYPDEAWLYINGELKDIFKITGKGKQR